MLEEIENRASEDAIVEQAIASLTNLIQEELKNEETDETEHYVTDKMDELLV